MVLNVVRQTVQRERSVEHGVAGSIRRHCDAHAVARDERPASLLSCRVDVLYDVPLCVSVKRRGAA